MKARIITGSILAIVALILLVSSVYTVDETEQVIILQFGKPVGDSIKDAGLHFKLPFIQDVTSFDKRVLEWDGDENQIPTSDKKIYLGGYICPLAHSGTAQILSVSQQ
jgi:membrane protease subunit HflC